MARANRLSREGWTTRQQSAAHAVPLEVDQGGRAHVEGEAPAPEEAGAAARLAVGLEDDGRKPPGLKAGGGRHARDPRADDGHVVHDWPASRGWKIAPSGGNRGG